MDKETRKSLISAYLTKSINLEDFNMKKGLDLKTMQDPLLHAIGMDLGTRKSSEMMKKEIIGFNEKQKQELTSMGTDYVERTKKTLTMQAQAYGDLLGDPTIRAIIEEWGTSNQAWERPASEYKNASFKFLLDFLKTHQEYNEEVNEVLSEIQKEKGLDEELQDFSDTLGEQKEERESAEEKREEFFSFLDNSENFFGSLLQLEDVDEEINKTAAVEAYEIYRTRLDDFKKELENDSNIFVTGTSFKFVPGKGAALEKKTELSQSVEHRVKTIEQLIKQLEEKYGSLDNKQKKEEGQEKHEEAQTSGEDEWLKILEEKSDSIQQPEQAKKGQEIFNAISTVARETTDKNLDQGR